MMRQQNKKAFVAGSVEDGVYSIQDVPSLPLQKHDDVATALSSASQMRRHALNKTGPVITTTPNHKARHKYRRGSAAEHHHHHQQHHDGNASATTKHDTSATDHHQHRGSMTNHHQHTGNGSGTSHHHHNDSLSAEHHRHGHHQHHHNGSFSTSPMALQDGSKSKKTKACVSIHKQMPLPLYVWFAKTLGFLSLIPSLASL